MNKKYNGCTFPGCDKPHRRNGYCNKHSAKFRNGTLNIGPHSKLCKIEKCFSKVYCNGKCLKHYSRHKLGIPINLPEGSKDKYQRGDLDFEHKDSCSWSRSVRMIFGDSCMICNWNEASCDVHHIIHYSKGGKHTLQNAIVLCPNHHRLVHRNKISAEELQRINRFKINEITQTVNMVEPLKG